MERRSQHQTPEDLKPLLGHPVEDARKAAEEAGYRFRVVISDGSYHVVTRDLRMDRINVETQGGAVVAAWIG